MAPADIDADFKAAIDAGTIRGAILCATDAQGNFVYNNALGERTLLSGEKRPHQLDDILFLASATKLLATIAALQCVDDGLLSLTGDLSAVAPELAAKKVLTGFSDDGQPLLEPQVRPITLEMLLSHSSGLTYHFLDPPIARWRNEFGGGDDFTKKKTVEELFDYPLAFQPGAGWMYGSGLDWAGRIVERVTGKKLIDRMHERLLSPLGITDAQFYPPTREDLRPRLVNLTPDDPEACGRAVIGSGDMNRRTEGDFGGHGLFMAGSDYINILRSLLANDGKILKPETVDSMFEHHLSPEATASHRAALAGSGGVFFRVGTAAGSEAGYGLGGLITLADVDGWYGERTLTWGGGLTLAWFIDRKNDLCGVGAVLASIPIDVPVVSELKQTFREGIYRKKAAWEKEQGA